MTKVTIDNNEYELDSLSQKAQDNIATLQFVQSELNRLQAQIAVYKTAEVSYVTVIKQEIDNSNS